MLLGGGSEAVVFRSDSATAVKLFWNSALNLSPVLNAEFAFAIKCLQHPHLVRVLELDVAAG